MEKKANIVLLLANHNDETTNGIFLKDRNWYHLYITIDENIKEDELPCWAVNKNKDTVYQIQTFEGSKNWNKVIATTNSSLKIGKLERTENCSKLYKDEKEFIEYTLPQPSPSFIKVFIDEYNKKNTIVEVMVEYEGIEWLDRPLEYFPKIHPKDNTITIRKVKDSYNREEVINLCDKLFVPKNWNISFDTWIEQNL